MLPSTIPIFPLPNVVLFPHVLLPLHIFEQRYRDMVESALESNRLIGMVLLRSDCELEYEGEQPVYSVGCAGVITHHQKLGDGRCNIVLRGTEKFRVWSEDASRSFRQAKIEPLPEKSTGLDDAEIKQRRKQLDALLAMSIEQVGSIPRLPETGADDALVNALSQYLDFTPLERQHLLERDGVLARAKSLIGLLEMHIKATGSGDNSSVVH
jgi:hypothetical protein